MNLGSSAKSKLAILPACAVHKAVNYLRYWGRVSRTAATAIFLPMAAVEPSGLLSGHSQHLTADLAVPPRCVACRKTRLSGR
jgi:hypothetical protein